MTVQHPETHVVSEPDLESYSEAITAWAEFNTGTAAGLEV